MSRFVFGVAMFTVAFVGCGDDDGAEPAEPPAAAVVDTPTPEEAPASDPDEEEACARILIVSHIDAQPRPASITRTKEEGRERIESFWQRVESGESFEELARAESDGRSTGESGGLAGTYARSAWPPLHADILDALYGLNVGQNSAAVDASYGWVLVRRCAVEHYHIRHILIRYAGAQNADEEVTRTREQAELLANDLRIDAGVEDVDFAALAREHSEDGSAENGGDLGVVGRGVLVAPVEDASLSIEAGQLSGVVESPFGFHVIQRVE